jgi:diguanylate cyclase (GGDEF)-like protein
MCESGKMHQDDTKLEEHELHHNQSPLILVADDSQDILNMLTDILTQHGYLVHLAESGHTALQSLAVEIPDLILLDVSMPDMDGYEICCRLKSDAHSCRIPVIFISGHDDTSDKIKAFQAGGVDYITKPFKVSEILARVKTHVSLSRLQKQIEGQNTQLQQEITERERAEEELRKHKTLLEEIVAERTAELRNTNEDLQREITERERMEFALEQTNYKLHSMVYEYGLRHQRISFFNQMTEQLQACSSIEETYPIIHKFSQKLIPAAAGALFMRNHTQNSIETVTTWGKSLAGKSKFIPGDCCALQKKKMHVTTDLRPDLYCPHLCGITGKSSLCVPLLAQGEILGMLHLQQQTSSGSPSSQPGYEDLSEGFNTEVQQVAVTVGDHLSLALANIKLRDTLRQQATRDPLTGLFNRRYMEETLARELHRAERYGTPLGIIMVDIDHFRRFNNIFGHEAGDIVLKELGKFLQDNVRKEDVACRYGGEEFTLILPGAALDITQKRAETLRCMAQHLQLYYNDKLLDNITLSLGVAIFPDNGATGDVVLQAADVALYSAKHAGRNRVAVAVNTIPLYRAEPCAQQLNC